MIIERLLFDREALRRLHMSDGIPNELVRGLGDDGPGGLHCRALPYVGPRTQLDAALLTGGDRVVGVAIGKDEGGRPASFAIKSDSYIPEGNSSHVQPQMRAERRLTVINKTLESEP